MQVGSVMKCVMSNFDLFDKKISHSNITLWKQDRNILSLSSFTEVIGSENILARLLTDYNPFRPWWKPNASSKLCFVTTQVGKDLNRWGKSEILIEEEKKNETWKKGMRKTYLRPWGWGPSSPSFHNIHGFSFRFTAMAAPRPAAALDWLTSYLRSTSTCLPAEQTPAHRWSLPLPGAAHHGPPPPPPRHKRPAPGKSTHDRFTSTIGKLLPSTHILHLSHTELSLQGANTRRVIRKILFFRFRQRDR